MAGNKPWIPIGIKDDDDVDKTARIRVLEVQQAHTTLSIDKLDKKLDKHASDMSSGLHRISSAIEQLKDDQLDDLRKKHEKEIAQTIEKTKTTGKVELMWAGIGAIVAILVAWIGFILKSRIGG